jgi:aspartate/methionine/tyrosine aminotransferase
LNLNPLLVGTSAPPIPAVRAWSDRYRGREPLIDLSQAVPGYPPPPELLARIAAAGGSLDAAAYGPITGDTALRSRYAEAATELYGGSVSADEIAITAGCNQAFVVTAMAVAAAGDAMILPLPWYFNHKMILDTLGIEAVALPCRAETGFIPSPDEAAALIGPRTRAIVLVSPNNPTGAIYPPATIAAFAELCTDRRIGLVIDETYRDFNAAEGRPHDLIAETDWQETLIQLYSFSKAYCIPGHRIGAVLAGQRFVAELTKILDCVQICPPRAPQAALTWAIGALSGWRGENRRTIARRAQSFRSVVSRIAGWSVASIGAYFAYVRHPFPGKPAAEVAEWLAADRGVVSLPASYFGPRQEDFLRLAYANVDVAAVNALPERLAGGGPG